MVVGRLRLANLAEWAVAAAFLAATVGVGALIVHELTSIGGSDSTPRPAPSAPTTLPATIPSLSIPVSVLPLDDGRQIRVGDTATEVARVLGREAEIEPAIVEPGAIDKRVTRTFIVGKVRFTLVFEVFERNGESRVAAIYVR